MSMYAIETNDLYKSYGPIEVLRGLDLQVQQGEVYGLLGPNGAGKSTLIYLLLGFLKPDAGSLQVLGMRDLDAIRGQVGYLPEQLRYHLRFSAREYLYFLGQFSDLDGRDLQRRIDEELEQVGLSNAADRKLATYSKGMLQRFGIAQALLIEPDVLLLDEPTSGLDPAFRYDVLDMLAKVRAHGHTIFICTHHLDVIEHLCDRVGVLSQGKLVAQMDVNYLRGIGASVNIQVSSLSRELQDQLCALSRAVHCSEYVITLRPNTHALQTEVIRILLDAGVTIISLESLERPIEHLYLEAVRAALSGQPLQPMPFQAETPQPEQPAIAPENLPSRDDPLLKELLQQSGSERREDEG
jgi:ABC-2 type transport system ATP-binding protein